MKTRAAVGFRAHSGWAAMVALGGQPAFPEMIERGRLALIDRAADGVAQPYHAAAEMDIADAGPFIEQSGRSSAALAREGLEALLARLRARNRAVAGCGVLFASGRPLGALANTLASHAMIHTAEGEFFRNAIVRAGEELHLPVTRIKERELWETAEAATRMPVEQLQRHLAAIGKAAGPPWRQDEKFAALAAWTVLAKVAKGERE